MDIAPTSGHSLEDDGLIEVGLKNVVGMLNMVLPPTTRSVIKCHMIALNNEKLSVFCG